MKKRKGIWIGILIFAFCLGLYQTRGLPIKCKILQATFRNSQGGTMEYYVVKTTYLLSAPDQVDGLHLDACRAVFAVEEASLVKEFEASGHPAAIYQGETENYICCTVSPEASVVMAYSPDSVAEKDAVGMINSIFEAPDS